MTLTYTSVYIFFNNFINYYINNCINNRFSKIIRDTASNYVALFIFMVCMLISLPSFAQLSVEIGGNGTQQYPVAILGITGGTVADEVTTTLRNDLTKTGLFRLISVGTLQPKTDVQQTPSIADLRNAGADFVVWGTVDPWWRRTYADRKLPGVGTPSAALRLVEVASRDRVGVPDGGLPSR